MFRGRRQGLSRVQYYFGKGLRGYDICTVMINNCINNATKKRMRKWRGEETRCLGNAALHRVATILSHNGSKATSWYCHHSFMLDRLRSPSPGLTYNSLSLNPYRYDLWAISSDK